MFFLVVFIGTLLDNFQIDLNLQMLKENTAHHPLKFSLILLN
jgi:hypothetical protein